MAESADFKIERRDGKIVLVYPDKEGSIGVRPLRVRPLTGKGAGISFLDKDKKEVAFLPALALLDEESRGILSRELEDRYLLPKIVRVTDLQFEFGVRYWKAETSLGQREFALREPHLNVIWVSEDHLVLRDTMGNRYEVESMKALDEKSRELVERGV